MEPLFAPACTSKVKELGFRKEKLVAQEPRDIHGRRDGFENRIPPPTKRRYDSQNPKSANSKKEHVETFRFTGEDVRQRAYIRGSDRPGVRFLRLGKESNDVILDNWHQSTIILFSL
jgi:hypothetical protein